MTTNYIYQSQASQTENVFGTCCAIILYLSRFCRATSTAVARLSRTRMSSVALLSRNLCTCRALVAQLLRTCRAPVAHLSRTYRAPVAHLLRTLWGPVANLRDLSRTCRAPARDRAALVALGLRCLGPPKGWSNKSGKAQHVLAFSGFVRNQIISIVLRLGFVISGKVL